MHTTLAWLVAAALLMVPLAAAARDARAAPERVAGALGAGKRQ
jgi:hypothetical protein